MSVGLTSAVYAILALRVAIDRTRDLKQLQDVEPDFTIRCYHRLMVLAVADILFTIPLTIYVTLPTCVRGCIGIAASRTLHLRFGRIDILGAIVWRQGLALVSLVSSRI